MDTENISFNMGLDKITFNLTRAFTLLIIYEVIGLVLYYLYKKYKYQKIRILSENTNKPCIYIRCMKDYNKLKNLPSNSYCILVDRFFEHIDPKYDIEYRNEINRVGNLNVLHIYRPFFLLSSYLRSERVFYHVNKKEESYMIVNTILTKILMIFIFMVISYIIGNYTGIKDSINGLLSYLLSKFTQTNLMSTNYMNRLKKGFLVNKDRSLDKLSLFRQPNMTKTDITSI